VTHEFRETTSGGRAALQLFMENKNGQRDKESSSKIDGKDIDAKDSEEVTEVVDQDPGERQKENQNQSKDDPLAA
jgi:hypothetical protein